MWQGGVIIAKVINTISKTIVNEDSQITHQEEEKIINWGTESNYIKVYLDTILYLFRGFRQKTQKPPSYKNITI